MSELPGDASAEAEPQPGGLRELFRLQEALGFIETPELTNLHRRIVDATGDDSKDVRHALTGEYQDLGRTTLADVANDDAHYGLQVAVAAIKLEAGYDFACLDDLEDVLFQLRQDPWFEDVANHLDQIMRRIESTA